MKYYIPHPIWAETQGPLYAYEVFYDFSSFILSIEAPPTLPEADSVGA